MTEFRRLAIQARAGGRVPAIDAGARRLAAMRAGAIAEMPTFEDHRDRARAVRLEALRNLDRYLARFADAVDEAGGTVHWASDAAEAREIIGAIVADAPRRGSNPVVVKSKSMVTEEIELNTHLESAGVEVVETDLGEFIVQQAGDRPSHIIAPVLHLTRRDVGELFAVKLGIPYTDDPAELNRAARRYLRDRFLRADVGISGVNMAVADTGSIALVTNEGNGRMVTSVPPTHVAVMGMERVVPTMEDLGVVLEVLARSATGQRLSTYTSIVTGPARAGDPDGPQALHVVIVDNGRSAMLAGPNAEALACIRCGACLNICPVFRVTGGHAYGGVYSGPIGAVFAPATGQAAVPDLPYASTLCGACRDVCPVRIDLPAALLRLRAARPVGGTVRTAVRAFATVASRPSAWDRALRLAERVAGGRGPWVRSLPWVGAAWRGGQSDGREVLLPRRPFRDRFVAEADDGA